MTFAGASRSGRHGTVYERVIALTANQSAGFEPSIRGAHRPPQKGARAADVESSSIRRHCPTGCGFDARIGNSKERHFFGIAIPAVRFRREPMSVSFLDICILKNAINV